MFFRNLTFFRFPLSIAHQFEPGERIEGASYERTAPLVLQGLAECALKPVGALEISSRGFVSPYGVDDDRLHVEIGDCVWLTVGGEDKILPASAVNRALNQKLAEIETREGRKPGGRTRKRIKEDVVAEMLPRALVKPVRIDAFLDLRRGFIAVDSPSRRAAESVVSEVRHAMGSFPALTLNAEVAPRSVLTGWVGGEPLPDGLAIAEECELKDAMDGGAVVKCQHQDLQGDEIKRHLEAGKQVTRLGLTYNDHLAFVLGEDLVVRKLRFLDGAVDQLENIEREDLQAELDARFALMTGEVGALFDVLEAALKISKAEG